MIILVVAVAYLLIGWMVAPRFARVARNEDIPDPGAFGLLSGALWPMAVVLIGGAALLVLLARIVASRAGIDDE